MSKQAHDAAIMRILGGIPEDSGALSFADGGAVPDFDIDSLPEHTDDTPTQDLSAKSQQPDFDLDNIPEAKFDVDALPEQGAKPKPEGELGTMGRAAAHEALPVAGAIAGGALAGSLVPGAGTLVGAGVGLLGAVAGGAIASGAQGMVQRALGIDDSEQLAVNAEENPKSAMAGTVIPQVVTGRVGAGVMAAKRAFNAAAMGGVTAIQEGMEGDVNTKDVAIAALTGAALPELRAPVGTKLAEAGEAIGTRIARKLSGATYNGPRVTTAPGELPLDGAASVDELPVPQPAVKSKGTAASEPPPAENAGVGAENGVQPGNRKTRGDDSYVKTPKQMQTLGDMFADMDPTTQAVFDTSLKANEPQTKNFQIDDSKEPLPLEQPANKQALSQPAGQADEAVGSDVSAPRQPEPEATPEPVAPVDTSKIVQGGPKLNKVLSRSQEQALIDAGYPREQIGQIKSGPVADKIVENLKRLNAQEAAPIAQEKAPAAQEKAPIAQDEEVRGARDDFDERALDNLPEIENDEIPAKAKPTQQEGPVTEPVTKEADLAAQIAAEKAKSATLKAQAAEVPNSGTKVPNKGKMAPAKVDPNGDVHAQIDQLLADKNFGKGVTGRRPLLELIRKNENLLPETKAAAFNKAHAFTPETVKQLYDSFRMPSYRPKTEEGVQVKDKEDLELKTEAQNRIRQAYETAVKAGEAQTKPPVTLQERQALRDRVKKAHDDAGHFLEQYTPNKQDRAYLWMKKARDLLTRKINPTDFWKEEQVLKTADAKDVQDTNKIDADKNLARREEGQQAIDRGVGATDITGKPLEGSRNFEGEMFDQGAEDLSGHSKLLKPEDLDVVKTNKTIDLLHLDSLAKTPEGKTMLDQMTQLAHNIVGLNPDGKIVPSKPESKYTKEAEALMGKTSEPKSTLAVDKSVRLKTGKKKVMEVAPAADKGRSIEVTPELRKRYGDLGEEATKVLENHLPDDVKADLSKALDKTAAPPEGYKKPKPGQADTSVHPPEVKDLAAEFLRDEGGGLNLSKIDNTWRTKINPAIKWLTDTVGHWTTDPAIRADAALAQHQADFSQNVNWLSKILDARWRRFLHGATKDEQIKYQLALEDSKAWDKQGNFNKKLFDHELEQAGISKGARDFMVDEAEWHKQVMDAAWKAERALGSTQDYVENYISHIFENEKEARKHIQDRIDQIVRDSAKGENWFTKERSFALIKEAMDAGFKLKYENPIDVIGARMRASWKYQNLMSSLFELQKMGLATRTQDADKVQKMNWKYKFTSGADGKEWIVAPEVTPLVQNALTRIGLRDRNDKIGSAYRAYMDVKNVFIPIKLGISGFHWVHVVANVNLVANVAREITNAQALTKHGMSLLEAQKAGLMAKAGDASWGQKLAYLGKAAPQAIKTSLKESVYSLPLDRFGHVGKEAMNAWDTEPSKLTPDQARVVQLIKEGGGIPKRNDYERLRDSKRLEELSKDNKYVQQLPYRLQQAVKVGTNWMFEHQIPALKTAAYLRDAQALFNRRPDLISNPDQRRVALRAIMKSADNRFGEMFYNSLFMNKVLKEASIGSFVSLGWNLGQVREFGGALSNIATGKGRLSDVMDKYKNATAREDVEKYDEARKGISTSQRTVYDATNKGAYTAAYSAFSMATAAALSYGLSGVFPSDWKDWFFPRVGGLDPEGQPRRLTTPFNTREPIMLKAHMDSEGPVGGIGAFIWNKMILSPLTDLVSNRDYYGNEIFDTNAPWYKKAVQAVDSTLGSQLEPMVVSGYKRGREQGGGGLKTALTAAAGFPPAPAYVNRSPFQRRLTELYNEHQKAHARPYEDRGPGHAIYNAVTGAEPSKNEKIRDAMSAYNQANLAGDKPGQRAAQSAMIKAGMSAETALHMGPGEADKRKFARLELTDQLALAPQMDDAEFKKYVILNPKVHGKNRIELMRLRKIKGSTVPSASTDEDED